MPLSEGARVGPYRILALVGVGGMGEVYRARDTRLERDVALKVLPEVFADNPDRLMRFEREARALAALNHVNIAHIHGTEANALAMEFVEGEDLQARLSRGPLPIDEVLAIAVQLVDALEVAHDAGIIHRDLKPANVKVRSDGVVKVLDFGLAKAVEGADATGVLTPISPSSPTVTSPALTKLGVVLGTAAYMAPEQARGRAVDKRADIWAFGCVVFELLSGRPPFRGDTSTDVIAAAITTEPAWDALPPAAGPGLRRLLRRCLEKDPRRRLRDIGDARWDLEQSLAADAFAPASVRRPSRLTPWLAGALLLVSAGFIATWVWRGRDAAPVRLSVTFPENAPMHLGQSQPSLAYSPDGRTIVYTATGPEGAQLWIRDVNAFAPVPIPGTAGGRLAFFSPDGKSIGFMANETIKKLPITLGPPTVVCKYAGVPMGATWTTRNEIVFATRATAQSLWRVPSDGGDPVAISSAGVWYPDALPGGNAVVVTTDNPNANDTTGDLTVAVVTLADGKIKKLFDGGTYVRYSPSGHLIFLRNNTLMAAPFDAATLTAGDTRTVVVDRVYMDQSLVSGNFAISPAGALAYAPGDAQDLKRTVVSFTTAGMTPLVTEKRAFRSPRVSADGKRITAIEQAWRDRIWVIDLERQSFMRLTTGRYLSESAPVWSPDGKRIVFRGVTDDQAIHMYVVPSDGSSPERPVLEGVGEISPDTWTPDGKSLIFTSQAPGGAGDLLMLDVDGPPNVRPVLKTPYSETTAALSPDGQWLAYLSNRSGRTEVYVGAYPALTSPTQISSQGGTSPVWARDGHRLFFRHGQDVMSVNVGGAASPSTPSKVLSFPMVLPSEFIDTMPDGRFVGINGTPVGTVRELRVVLNWFDELRQKAK